MPDHSTTTRPSPGRGRLGQFIDEAFGSRWAIGLWAAGLGCLLALLLPTGSPARVIVINGTGIVAAAIFLRAVTRMPGRAGTVWWWLWIYMVLTIIGDLVYDYYLYRLQEEPFPSLADVFYLGSYGALTAALVLLVRRRQSGRNRETWIDTAVMTLAVACVVATLVVVPVLADSATPDTSTIVALAYPLFDVIALSALIRLLVDTDRVDLPLRLLTVSVALTLSADLAFQSLDAQGLVTDAPAWLDVLYLAAVYLLTAAATARGAIEISKPATANRRTKARLIGLGVAAITAPVLLALSIWNEAGSQVRLLAVASIAILLLILWGSLLLVSMVERQAALLTDLARRDGLTGLPNRRTWDFELERAEIRTTEEGTPLTVALLDLDHFKAFNDRYGHPEGDRLLVSSARAWHALLDPPAMLARYGGEEFAVLLPGISLEQAGPLLDRIRAATPGSQTVSIGYAQQLAAEPATQTVVRADAALYRAKERGRDRVEADVPQAAHIEV